MADPMWRSPADPSIVMTINETKPELNLYNDLPASIQNFNHTKLLNGNLAVSWTVATFKEVEGVDLGVSNIYARVFNPQNGSFITGEIQLTDSSDQLRHLSSHEIFSSNDNSFIINYYDAEYHLNTGLRAISQNGTT